MPRAKKLHLLCILTSKQVFWTPFAGRNNLFRRENSLIFISQLMTSQRKSYIVGINRNMLNCTKTRKKNLGYYSWDYLLWFEIMKLQTISFTPISINIARLYNYLNNIFSNLLEEVFQRQPIAHFWCRW